MKRLAFAGLTALALVVVATAAGASRPSAPAIAGPDGVTPGKHAYVFSSVEKDVPASKIRFRCSLDTSKLHACARRVSFRLTAGTHLLRAQAVDPAGHTSVLSKLRIEVQAVAPALKLTTVWHKLVTTAQFASAEGALFSMAVGPDGNLYLADPGDDQIQVYDPSGNLLRTWGSRGTGTGQFNFEFNPDLADAKIPFSALGIDQRTGEIYVGESQRMQKFGSQGNYELGWGKVGSDNGEFTRVADLTVGPTGIVYVMEDRPLRQGRVEEFDSNGNFVTNFGRGLFADPGGIALDGAGDILVADDEADTVKMFDAGGKFLRNIGQAGAAPGQLMFPADLAVTGNTLYVADDDHFRVVRFNLATGRPTGYWSTGTATEVGLAIDSTGSLYELSSTGLLMKVAVSD
jgi:hypothetical protein